MVCPYCYGFTTDFQDALDEHAMGCLFRPAQGKRDPTDEVSSGFCERAAENALDSPCVPANPHYQAAAE